MPSQQAVRRWLQNKSDLYKIIKKKNKEERERERFSVLFINSYMHIHSVIYLFIYLFLVGGIGGEKKAGHTHDCIP